MHYVSKGCLIFLLKSKHQRSMLFPVVGRKQKRGNEKRKKKKGTAKTHITVWFLRLVPRWAGPTWERLWRQKRKTVALLWFPNEQPFMFISLQFPLTMVFRDFPSKRNPTASVSAARSFGEQKRTKESLKTKHTEIEVKTL